jgi:hypothetical protein
MNKDRLVTVAIALFGIAAPSAVWVARYFDGHHWTPLQWETHHREYASDDRRTEPGQDGISRPFP